MATASRPTAPLRVVVVDDERLGRERVLRLLAAVPDVEVVAVAETGRGAVEAIRQEEPSAAFLDVRMPDLTGLGVVREVGVESMPPTVFVTAHDRNAVEAFEVAAVDYLTKPFEDGRFFEALDRVREAVRLRRTRAEALRSRADASLTKVDAPHAYPSILPVEARGLVRFVPVEKIDVVEADGSYAVLHVGGDRYAIRKRMKDLEDRLDPARFCRIHRSTIVRLDLVDGLLIGSPGDYAVLLSDGREFRVSRGRRDVLEARLRGEASSG